MQPKRSHSLLITGLSALFFLPFLGGVHLFDWDEINFAEIAREMLLLDEYLRVYINFEPFWEKPPLFFWLQGLSMSALGVGEYAARLPNALCGILSLNLLYRIGTRLYDRRFGLLWAGAYFGSILPHLYFKSGIIDPWFNLFIFLGLYGLIRYSWTQDKAYGFKETVPAWVSLIVGGLMLGLAVLTKGPAAYAIMGLTVAVYFFSRRFKLFVPIPAALVYAFLAFLPALLWFGVETLRNGPWFVTEFTRYQIRLFTTEDAGHGGFPGYHIVVLLVGCFPASFFALRGMRNIAPQEAFQADFRRWMLILFAVVLVLFSIVQSKIVHYSSLCYFPLTYLAALSLHQLMTGRIKWHKGLSWGMGIIGSIFALACIAAPFIGNQLPSLAPQLTSAPFALANMQAEVDWPYWTVIPGLIILGLLVFGLLEIKKGNWQRAATGLFVGTAVFVMSALISYVGRVEGYSQRAAIEFWEGLQGKDVHVVAMGYKSYAPWFYSRKQPETGSPTEHMMMRKPITKDVYAMVQVHKVEGLKSHVPELEEVGRKNGFVLLIRRATN